MNKLGTTVKWFYPGMRIKRWIALSLIGLLVAQLGISALTHGKALDMLVISNRIVRALPFTKHSPIYSVLLSSPVGIGLILLGILLVLFAAHEIASSITGAISPSGGAHLVNAIFERRMLAAGPEIVVIGGGTGLSTLLRGLKRYSSNITAVVTVADDGGSSGRLRRDLDIPAPGDIRNCLMALADAEPTMSQLFQHRFRHGQNGEGLRDHAFGNLLIAAMAEINGGDFEKAVRETSRVLNIRGRVLPSTKALVQLKAEMGDGSLITGETAIATSPLRIRRIGLEPPNAEPVEEVMEAIELADLIVIGPGSVFTSIIPNLLVDGIAAAIHRSRAKKVYVCNVMTQPGETDHYAASEHVKAIQRHVHYRIFDYVMVNIARPNKELLDKYLKSGSTLVEPDCDRIRALELRPVAGDYISQTDVVRHDPSMLARALIRLLGR